MPLPKRLRREGLVGVLLMFPTKMFMRERERERERGCLRILGRTSPVVYLLRTWNSWLVINIVSTWLKCLPC
jgi:hypothetical protein